MSESKISERLVLLQKDYGLDLVQELVQIFAKDYSEVLLTLESSLANADFEKVKFCAHRLKSGGANLGATHFAELGHYFEMLGPEIPPEALQEQLLRMKNEYQKALKECQEFLIK